MRARHRGVFNNRDRRILGAHHLVTKRTGRREIVIRHFGLREHPRGWVCEGHEGEGRGPDKKSASSNHAAPLVLTVGQSVACQAQDGNADPAIKSGFTLG